MKEEEIKAYELYVNMNDSMYSDCKEDNKSNAKIAALIAVDTMLQDLDEYLDSHYHEERISYWNKVREYLSKL